MNKIGIGVDFHSLVKGDHLVVGGHRIECEFASQAHSDGDVLTHSVIDALLGALNLGDIGENFPNTPEYLNVASIELLKKVVQKMPQKAGGPYAPLPQIPQPHHDSKSGEPTICSLGFVWEES